MEKLKSLVVLLLLIVLIYSCKDKEDDTPKPADLLITETVSTNGSGEVSFVATAKNAKYFHYYFGENSNEGPTKSDDGTAKHTYTASGKYTVKVAAYSTERDSIVGTKEINVVVTAALGDLTISETVANDGSGKVTITATAENAQSFDFHFGSYENEPVTKTTDGVATFTYVQPGTYLVTVNAFGEASQTKKVRKLITVDRPLNNIGYTTPDTYEGMQLSWGDEFNGSSLNIADWNFETGTGQNGWGNSELQYYREENTTVADGMLTITAKKESFGGRSYTSSRMTTQGKKVYKYGRVDARAILPKGQGLWPAIWALGENLGSVGWPECGEIDIMELIGGLKKDNVVHGTVHWGIPPDSKHASFGKAYTLQDDNFANKFHVFSIVWDATKIVWFVDDVKFHEINITPADLSEFHQPFFFIMNVAVGGRWPGNPDDSTIFPQKMIVDYIRVFQPL